MTYFLISNIAYYLKNIHNIMTKIDFCLVRCEKVQRERYWVQYSNEIASVVLSPEVTNL